MSPMLRAAPWVIAVTAGLLGLVGVLHYRDAYHALQARVAAAVAEQARRDRVLSAELLEAQRRQLDALHAETVSQLKVMANAPVTNDCGPVMRAASHGVRAVLGGGAAPARP
jgi:hypothetical protein